MYIYKGLASVTIYRNVLKLFLQEVLIKYGFVADEHPSSEQFYEGFKNFLKSEHDVAERFRKFIPQKFNCSSLPITSSLIYHKLLSFDYHAFQIFLLTNDLENILGVVRLFPQLEQHEKQCIEILSKFLFSLNYNTHAINKLES